MGTFGSTKDLIEMHPESRSVGAIPTAAISKRRFDKLMTTSKWGLILIFPKPTQSWARLLQTRRRMFVVSIESA
jgi:hypothetical protein